MYELSCRAHPSGKGLTPVAPVDGSLDPAASARGQWIVFIHGFNNSLKRAGGTWRETTLKLGSKHGVTLDSVILFYWPGDYSLSRICSAMNYPRTVPIAEETARHLSEYISRVAVQRSVPLELSFVAHSLGALVVLETCRLLGNAHANVSVVDMLLMAAAVPEGFCVEGEPYGRCFSSTSHEAVLHSLDDNALKWFFQVGQEIAQRFPAKRRLA